MNQLRRRLYSTEISKFYDLIICGGGMIGMTMACSLAKDSLFKNHKILIIDAAPKKSYEKQKEYSNRVSAINPTSRKLFEDLGIWNHIRDYRYRTVKRMKIWSESYNLSTNFASKENVAYIVENDLIIDSAIKELQTMNNVTIMYGEKISKLDYDNHKYYKTPIVSLEDKTNLHCDLLIGADGANSFVRKFINVQYIDWSYDRMAIVCTLKIMPNDIPNEIAWQRFIKDGPMAILPLDNEQSSLVWCTSKENAKQLMKLDIKEFVNELNFQFHTVDLKNISNSSKFYENLQKQCNLINKDENIIPPFVETLTVDNRAVFPLGFGHAVNYISNNVVLVGDAAHRVHPLAGQGVNMGFYDIKVLTKVLHEVLINGNKLACNNELSRYEQQSQSHHLPIMMGIEFFHRVYNANHQYLRPIQNLGYFITDSVPPLKKLMQSIAT